MDFLFIDTIGCPLWLWRVFLMLVLCVLVLDLGVIHRKPHEIGFGESLLLSAFCIGIGLAFCLWIFSTLGQGATLDYLMGFVVEKSLAMDNIFVIAVIFGYFRVSRLYQHKLLVYGILGVVVLRGLIIGAGTAAVTRYEWLLEDFRRFPDLHRHQDARVRR